MVISPLTIFFLFKDTLNTYNSDGCNNENEQDPEFVYPIVVARVFDICETYYEPIGNDVHFCMKEKY